MEAKWFVYIGDHAEGPFTPEQIERGLRDGKLAAGFLAWTRGMKDWLPLQEIEELRSRLLDRQELQGSGGKRVGTLTELMGLPRSPEERSDWIGPAERARALAEADRTLRRMESERRGRENKSLRMDIWRQVRAILWAMSVAIFVGLLFGATWLYLTRDAVDSPLRTFAAQRGRQFPEISKWIDPIPALSVWSAADRDRLSRAASQPFGRGNVALEWTIEAAQGKNPAFWVVANLPLQTRLRLRADGIRGTLDGVVQSSHEVYFWLTRPWAEVGLSRESTAFSLPRGNYLVRIWLDSKQLPEVSERLALSGYRPGIELRQGQVFLGGADDQAYREALLNFNRTVREGMRGELDRIASFVNLVFEQREDTVMISSLTGKTKNAALKKKLQELEKASADRIILLEQTFAALNIDHFRYFNTWVPELRKLRSAETLSGDLPALLQSLRARIEQKRAEIAASTSIPSI